jgi:glycosyltransferase involved in cell wall biosynthesis
LFYQVIKIISNFKNVNCIDLIHAFSKPDRGIEDESVKFIQYLDKRITISEKTKKDLTFQYEEQSLIGDYVERIEVIPNGISLNKIKSRKKTEIKNVLFLGRDSKEKNFELFIELAKLCPNCNFWALGPSKRDKLPNNLKCMGVVSSENEKQKWLQKCDALIVTSYREGFPISIMEAMAFGLVVISTNVGAISEHILNSKNGYLVNLRESNKDIAIEMAEIINKSSTNQINDISRNAIDYARKNFDIENFNQKYRTLFSR